MKFRYWKSCQHFCNAKLKDFSNRKRKPGHHLSRVSVDLTRRQYLQLNKAKRLIEDSESINHVFADVNCSLGMEFRNGGGKYFNSEKDLCYLINN